MESNVKYEKSCGAIVFNGDGNECKVLLIGFTFKDKFIWGLPKGHMEKSETETQTALREIKEETDLNVQIVPGFKEKTEFSCKENTEIQAVYFAAESKSKETHAQKGEVEKCEWFVIDSAIEKITFECDKNILRKFKKFYEKNLSN